MRIQQYFGIDQADETPMPIARCDTIDAAGTAFHNAPVGNGEIATVTFTIPIPHGKVAAVVRSTKALQSRSGF